MMRVAAVIPALNEEGSIAQVIGEIPRAGDGFTVAPIVVGDNGSTDRTAEVAREAGAEVVRELERGYGAACLKALAALADDPPDAVVFLNADRSEYPEEFPRVLEPIINGTADLVIGSRVLGGVDPRSMSAMQRWGNWLVTTIVRLRWGVRFTDLGPFRAITWEGLQRIQMRDRNWGWTIEMQIKGCKRGLRCAEVPVSHRERETGEQKISGHWWGSLKAGAKILWVTASHAMQR
jgi:glycosyltransferase involved in cell wall biosynthesis